MSEMFKCNKCNRVTPSDSSGYHCARLTVDIGHHCPSTFHLCPRCHKELLLNFLSGCSEQDYTLEFGNKFIEEQEMVSKEVINSDIDILKLVVLTFIDHIRYDGDIRYFDRIEHDTLNKLAKLLRDDIAAKEILNSIGYGKDDV